MIHANIYSRPSLLKVKAHGPFGVRVPSLSYIERYVAGGQIDEICLYVETKYRSQVIEPRECRTLPRERKCGLLSVTTDSFDFEPYLPVDVTPVLAYFEGEVEVWGIRGQGLYHISVVSQELVGLSAIHRESMTEIRSTSPDSWQSHREVVPPKRWDDLPLPLNLLRPL